MVLGMALVTYVPRALPFIFLDKLNLPPFWESVLQNVRYAVLGALIFPGLFLINEDPTFGLLGGSVAFAIAYTGVDVIFTVLAAIVALVLYSLLF